jgi:preprotein translocase subunit SecF
MLRILHDTKIDFIRLWKITTVVTLLFILPGLAWIAVSGYKYSIEFTGGTLMQVRFVQAPNVADVRSTLDQAGIKGAEITQFGTDLDYLIRAQDPRAVAQQTRGAESIATEIQGALTKRFGATAFAVQRTEAVGPKVGGELRQKAIYAILLSFLITLGYLAWRFEWRFGVAAVIATAHDILATLAFIKYANLEISLVVVGGILTMIGYSLNDTIIIFDRVRENLRRRQKIPLYDTLNRSVNETLPRSVLTHATVFATLLALALLGGEVLRPFALVMLFGVVTGTFSSIYVAPPLLLWIEHKWPRAAEGGVVGRAKGAAPSRPASRSTAASTSSR